MEEMEKDVPRRTVMVLLVITIIVTALGAWTVLDRMSYSQAEPKSAGQVSLTIIQPDASDAAGNAAASPQGS